MKRLLVGGRRHGTVIEVDDDRAAIALPEVDPVETWTPYPSSPTFSMAVYTRHRVYDIIDHPCVRGALLFRAWLVYRQGPAVAQARWATGLPLADVPPDEIRHVPASQNARPPWWWWPSSTWWESFAPPLHFVGDGSAPLRKWIDRQHKIAADVRHTLDEMEGEW